MTRLLALFALLFSIVTGCSSADFDVQTRPDADAPVDDAAPDGGRDAVMVKPPEAGADAAPDGAPEATPDAGADDASPLDTAPAPDTSPLDTAPAPDTSPLDTAPAPDAGTPCNHCLGGTGVCPSAALDEWCWHSSCGDRSSCYFTTGALGPVCHCGV